MAQYSHEQHPSRRRRSRSFGRSGWMTAVVIVLLLLTFGLLWRAHQKARFHQLTATVIPETISSPMPGGQEAILLSRVALANNAEPEFVSATVLPGIGMQLLQATIAGPDLPAQQDLLASVSVSDAARMPTADVRSAPFHIRVGTHHLQEKGDSEDLVAFRPATDAHNQTLVDGGQATGTFQGSAKSGVSAAMEITLSGRQLDIIARLTNLTDETRFVSFEWSPRFLAPSGSLSNLTLFVPSRGVASSLDSSTPEGAFATDSGRALSDTPLDLRFARLGHDFLSDGTFVRLQNRDHYFVRILGMGDTLRSVRASTDTATHSLLLNLSSLDLAADAEQRDQTLRSRGTIQWHLRMEVLPVKTPQSPDFVK